MSYVLSLDQGTTSSRAIIFDHDSRLISVAQREHRQIYPRRGWVEHDPLEIWTAQRETAVEALCEAGLTAAEIRAVGITNQRETTIVWERRSGRPIAPAIVWQDRRTASFCDRIRERHAELIREKTGLEVDAYFSASKIRWILENIGEARRRAERGELCFGTVDSWLVWNLTGGACHLTDVSNASRTLLFNIHELVWDERLLEIFEIPPEILPEVRSSSEVYAEIKNPAELSGIKISGIAGDQQAALFGQLCLQKGQTKNTYGTGCFMLQNTGTEAVKSEHRLLTTIAWQIGERTEYALEGSVFIGGAVIQWLRDELQIIDEAAAVEGLANTVSDNGGVFFVPAFAGLGTPFWDQSARGLIIGLTRGTGRAHIARAAIESIAFQVADLLDAMRADSGADLHELKVDGGATGNETLLQFQADILRVPLVRSKIQETTALGAAYLAGLAAGFWSSGDDLAEHWRADRRFEPQMPAERAEKMRRVWAGAVRRSLGWEDTGDV